MISTKASKKVEDDVTSDFHHVLVFYHKMIQFQNDNMEGKLHVLSDELLIFKIINEDQQCTHVL